MGNGNPFRDFIEGAPYSYLLLRDIFREDRVLIVLEYCN